jgi:16S rRNA (guanine527-N7)-methyltransferase
VKHEIIREEFTSEAADEIRSLWQRNKKDLSEYVDRLMWWNKKINLVSRDVPRETITLHLEHSLSITQSDYFKGAEFIIDSGTGGGLPGIPLAITSPEKTVLMNDVVSKKVMACKHMASGVGLKNTLYSSKSIQLVDIPEDALVVSKHAFKINDLVGFLEGKSWENIILLKGVEDIEVELEGLDQALTIRVLKLEAGFKNEFYRGKAMVEVSKKETR